MQKTSCNKCMKFRFPLASMAPGLQEKRSPMISECREVNFCTSNNCSLGSRVRPGSDGCSRSTWCSSIYPLKEGRYCSACPLSKIQTITLCPVSFLWTKNRESHIWDKVRTLRFQWLDTSAAMVLFIVVAWRKKKCKVPAFNFPALRAIMKLILGNYRNFQSQ